MLIVRILLYPNYQLFLDRRFIGEKSNMIYVIFYHYGIRQICSFKL